jgi:PAS domain S-box-containing protein
MPTRVLVVEPDSAFAGDVRAGADRSDDFEIVTAGTLGDALANVAAAPPDAVVLALQLPDSNGLDTLRRLRTALTRETPIVVVGAADAESLAHDAIETGAQGYLARRQADGGAVVHALRTAIHRISIHRRLIQSEAALRDSEARRTAVLDSAFDAIVVMDVEGVVVEINAAAERMFGYSRRDAVGRDLFSLIVPAEHRDAIRADIARHDATVPSAFIGRRVEIEALRADATRVPIELSVARVDTGDGAIVTAWIRDLTERRRSEEALRVSEAQLRQAQKMEAIGRLAGGVAHDFNNVLTAIFGYADLLIDSDSFAPDHRGRADVIEIKRAAERAANLTRQLLAFSRKQVLQPRRVRLNDVVTGMAELLRRLIGEDVELRAELDPRAGDIRADPGQLEQVLMNLAANARDAMPGGGRLSISTANETITAEAARGRDGFVPGDFVRLDVTDTGEGIVDDVRRHIFEPFFTTKEQGKGTGLGLATVYGIVKQSGGWIYVASEPGVGTTFSIYLSRLEPTSSP